MIATPTKSDSNNNSSNNIKKKDENSDNKVIKDNNLPNLLKSDKIKNLNNYSDKKNKKISEIHEAIISDDLEKLANLLKLGENPDILYNSGETPLYLSVDIENYDAMVILLEFGADCNIQKEDGDTPLHLATEKKNEIYISNLLSHGANPNIINKINSQTPLHIGIINRVNEFILSKFKENNGDIYNIKDKFNKTPFDYSLNDEKYKKLLISIFGNNNDINNIQINPNYINNNINKISQINDDNSNLDYNNFVTLSRKIQLSNEDKDENNNNKEEQTIIYNKANNDQNNNLDSNNINEVNNCLKKQLLFSSNSKEIFSEEKNEQTIKNISSNNISQENQEKDKSIKSKGEIKKNMVNVISDKSSNYSNSLNENINPGINLKQNSGPEKSEQIYYHNLTEANNNVVKNLMLSLPYKKSHISESLHPKYILTTVGNNQENKIISHSLNLSNKNCCYYILNNKLRKKSKGKNNINPILTLYTNTNGNNSLSSYNPKKEGISDINPMEMINQMASSNNSNIFSELQINSNEKVIETKKTEEEFNDNKMTYNDGLNTLNENISENFSINNNNYNEEENNKENINFNNNSFDDSLEYSKSKSFNVNETPAQISLKKNEILNENEEGMKIDNKDESLNIYTNFHNDGNNNSKNIERYKNTTSNKSKQENDNDSEQSYGKSSSISNISAFNNKSNKSYRHLSYHNNSRQLSNNNNIKTYNSKTLNYTHNNVYYLNKENIEPNYIKSEKSNKNIIKNRNKQNIKEPYTIVTKRMIYKGNANIPENIKEQKIKESTMDDYRSNENIILINDMSNYNTGTLDNTNLNQFNTYYSDNNSNNKNNTKESFKYSNLFKKALKKKCVIKEFSNNNQYDKYTLETENYFSNNINNNNENDTCTYNEKEIIIHPQQISNELITKLRDWLISCDLLCYYNILIKNNIYDIDAYITNLRNNKINISYKDIENLGIKKPGHIFRFLLKLQMDIGILDNRICSFIINKFSENSLTTLGMNMSTSEIKYCGFILCPGEERFTKNSNYYDIFSFLRCKELMQFKENFIHNGFDQIEFILIQLFSCFAFNKEILNDYMHIYSDKNKKKVITKLYEEKKKLANLMGIDYNNNEVKQILDESLDESDSEGMKNEDFCQIF